MNMSMVYDWLSGFGALMDRDPEVARALVELGRKAAGRERARLDGEVTLEPVRFAPVTLEDLGVKVAGCSACAYVKPGKKCAVCGAPYVRNQVEKKRQRVPRRKQGKFYK